MPLMFVNPRPRSRRNPHRRVVVTPPGVRIPKRHAKVAKNPSAKGSSKMPKLYGAAANAHAKKKSRLARSRAAKARWRQRRPVARRPGRTRNPAGWTETEWEKEVKRMKRTPMSGHFGHFSAAERAAIPAAKKTRPKKKKRTAGKKVAKRTKKRVAKRTKTVARALAAKTSRAKTTPKKKRKTTMAKTKKGKGGRRRARRTRKLTRSQRARRASYRRWHKKTAKGIGRTLKRARRRPMKALARARRTIRRARATGNSGVRKYLKAHKMYRVNPKRRRKHNPRRRYYSRRRNPATDPATVAAGSAKGAVMSAIKAALPIAISLYASRALSRKILPKIPGLDRLGIHAAPVGALGMVVFGHIATKKVKRLAKYRASVMIGFGLNAVDVLLNTYAPASIKAMVGLGDSYDGLQQAVGEYVQTGEYLETGDYIGVGAEEELGLLEAEMGSDLQIGSGIGAPQGSMLSPVASQSMLAPVGARSFTRQIPGVGPDYDSNMSELYKGIFAGGF